MNEHEPRVETGSVVFGSDWPGLFLRGDDAIYYGAQLRTVLDATENMSAAPEVLFAAESLRNLERRLRSVDVSSPFQKCQQLRSARECLPSMPTQPGPVHEPNDEV